MQAKTDLAEKVIDGSIVLDKDIIAPILFFYKKYRGRKIYPSIKMKYKVRDDIIAFCRLLFAQPQIVEFIQLHKQFLNDASSAQIIRGIDRNPDRNALRHYEKLLFFYELNKNLTAGTQDRRTHLFFGLKGDVMFLTRYLISRTRQRLRKVEKTKNRRKYKSSDLIRPGLYIKPGG